MITTIVMILSVIVIICWMEWRFLKRTTPITRRLFLVFLLMSGGIWSYLLLADPLLHPAVMLEQLLEPFDPVR